MRLLSWYGCVNQGHFPRRSEPKDCWARSLDRPRPSSRRLASQFPEGCVESCQSAHVNHMKKGAIGRAPLQNPAHPPPCSNVAPAVYSPVSAPNPFDGSHTLPPMDKKLCQQSLAYRVTSPRVDRRYVVRKRPHPQRAPSGIGERNATLHRRTWSSRWIDQIVSETPREPCVVISGHCLAREKGVSSSRSIVSLDSMPAERV